MPLLLYWKPISIALLCIGIGYMGWHERDIRADAEMATYKASVAQAQATQAAQAAQTTIKNAQDVSKSVQDNAQALTTLSQFYSNLLRQRQAASGGKSVPSDSRPPTRIAEVPTNCIPLAAQSAITTQDYMTLYNRVLQYQQNSQITPPQ